MPGSWPPNSLLGEAEHREAAAGELVVQRLETFVLRREPALAGDVHRERHLAAEPAEVGGLAVESLRREVVERHAADMVQCRLDRKPVTSSDGVRAGRDRDAAVDTSPAGRYPDAMARRISMALLLVILSVPAWAGDRDDKAAAERAEVAAKRSENAAVRAENAAAQVDAAAARLERLAEELERQQGQRRRRQHP